MSTAEKGSYPRRAHQLSTRVTAEEREHIERAATLCGKRSVSDFLRWAAVKVADEIKAKESRRHSTRTPRMTLEEAEAVLAAYRELEQVEPPDDALGKLVRPRNPARAIMFSSELAAGRSGASCFGVHAPLGN